MKRFSFRDTLLMLAPVAVLGAFGWLLSARKPAIVAPTGPFQSSVRHLLNTRKPAVIAPTGPFQPFIGRVRVLPATAEDVFDGYDTRAIVEFDAHGRLPSWWSQGFSGYEVADRGQLAGIKGNKTVFLRSKVHCDSPHLDSDSKKWTSEYRLKLRELPPGLAHIRLSDTVEFGLNFSKPVLKLGINIPIRDNGVTTKLPTVSRVACVKVESFSLEPTPPIESRDGVRRWRVRWTLLKNIPRIGAEKNHEGAELRVAIVNRTGEQVGSAGTTFESSQDETSSGFGKKPNDDPRRRFIGGDYLIDSRKAPPSRNEPLWLEGTIRSGDAWPLAVKIPLRDAAGKMLFTPRTSTVPFRVVSVTKVAPRPDEVK